MTSLARSFLHLTSDIAMNDLIAELIHSSKGYFHETAGVVICFFNDPEQALSCATKIKASSDKVANVCGSQLSIIL
jgi:hypothetical protein